MKTFVKELMVKVGLRVPTLKMVTVKNGLVPKYESGKDLRQVRADIRENKILAPGSRHIIPTGFYVDVPKGWMLTIHPSPGCVIHKGLIPMMIPILPDHKQEVVVILVNTSTRQEKIIPGEIVGQLALERAPKFYFERVANLPK